MKRLEQKKKKRREAEERTASRAERTDEQQIRRLDNTGKKAAKERTRLLARIEVKKRVDRSKKSENTRRNTKRN